VPLTRRVELGGGRQLGHLWRRLAHRRCRSRRPHNGTPMKHHVRTSGCARPRSSGTGSRRRRRHLPPKALSFAAGRRKHKKNAKSGKEPRTRAAGVFQVLRGPFDCEETTRHQHLLDEAPTRHQHLLQHLYHKVARAAPAPRLDLLQTLLPPSRHLGWLIGIS
jgi:hypothetical protein